MAKINPINNNRTITSTLAPIVEQLELNQPEFVTIIELKELAENLSITRPVGHLTTDLRQRGWLLPTPVRGVYEFSPGANAGAYSRSGVLRGIKAIARAYPNIDYRLSLQSALYLQDISNQYPDIPQIMVNDTDRTKTPHAFKKYKVSNFSSRLEPDLIDELPVQKVETLLIQIVSKPTLIRNWSLYLDFLPQIWNMVNISLLNLELENRPESTKRRLAYLLSGVNPELSQTLMQSMNNTKNVIYFGPRKCLKHNMSRFIRQFNVQDNLLPLNPKEIEPL